jgi:formate-dependent nitrite reductase membrane component NrfD
MDSLVEKFIALFLFFAAINSIQVMLDFYNKKKFSEAALSTLWSCLLFYFSMLLLGVL